MKHLKRFNFNKDLKEFCENHLVYLLDDGFTISTMSATEHDDSGIYIQIYKDGYSRWSLLQDSFIPFLHILSRKYKMLNISALGVKAAVCFSGRFKAVRGSSYYFYPLQEVLDESSERGFPNVVDKIILKVDNR
jgi:hypothetical protein